MEETDNCEGLMRKALAVNDIPEDFDPNKVPQTGEEYIHWVMYEARHCQEWVTAALDTAKIPKQHTPVIAEPVGLLTAPTHMLPALSWQQKTVADFAAFRLHIQQIKLDGQAVPNAAAFNGESEQWLKKCSAAPKLGDVLWLSQRHLCKVLAFQLEWLEDVQRGDGVTYTVGAWLYAILACLETPLMPETCADLRQVARKCSQIRAALAPAAPALHYKPLNLFICVIARYFKNHDLVDDAPAL